MFDAEFLARWSSGKTRRSERRLAGSIPALASLKGTCAQSNSRIRALTLVLCLAPSSNGLGHLSYKQEIMVRFH